MEAEMVLRYRNRKLGKITPATDKLAYERVVRLPADLAVVYSAVQNFRLDLAKGFHHSLDVWEKIQASYFQELQELLIQQRCNHYPGNNNEPWIHVSHVGTMRQPTDRAVQLKEIFDALFARNDEKLLDSDLYPTPHNCVTMQQIQRLYRRVNNHLYAH
jgi:hypothetical protein